MPRRLTLVPKDAPILREIMPPVSDFSDPELHAAIEDMLYSITPEQLEAAGAPLNNAAGMAANQWGIRRRIFIFTPEGSAPEKPRAVMINPAWTPQLRTGEKEPLKVAGQEGCFSVPLTVGLVNRYDAIFATWKTPKGENKECTLEGWEARVFQHETDHLDGRLFAGEQDGYSGPECLERTVFHNEEEMQAYRSSNAPR